MGTSQDPDRHFLKVLTLCPIKYLQSILNNNTLIPLASHTTLKYLLGMYTYIEENLTSILLEVYIIIAIF